MDYIAYKHIHAGEQELFLRHFSTLDITQNTIDYLVLLGEYSFAFDDFSLYEKNHKAILDALIEEFYKESCHTTPWIAGVYTAIKLAESHFQDPAYLQALIDLREYLFTHNLREGTLIMSSKHRYVQGELFSVCSPYIIFDAEDLVVVSAFNEICSTDFYKDPSTLLQLLLYGLVKREYSFVRNYITYYEGHYPCDDPLYLFLIWRMRRDMGAPVLHRPYGNSNPYCPQPYERFPKVVSTDDIVTIQAVCQGDTSPLLHIGEKSYLGVLQDKSTGCWEFSIGPFPAGVINYSISYGSYYTETYECEIFERKYLSQLLDQSTYALKSTDTYVTIVPKGDILEVSLKKELPTDNLLRMNDGNLATIEGVDSIQIDLRRSYILGDILYMHWIFPVGTNYYGMGERFNTLSQSEGVVDNFVYSQYKDQGRRTYMPIPLCFTSEDIGLFINSRRNTHFFFDRTEGLGISLQSKRDAITLLRGSHHEMLSQYWNLTGMPHTLPAWTLGPWMSSNNWSSQGEVLNQMERTLSEDIPSTVLVIEQWSDEATFYLFNDAIVTTDNQSRLEYNDCTYRGRWENPKAMVDTLHQHGLRCVLWQIPVIKSTPNLRNIQRNKDLAYAESEGYLVRSTDRTTYTISEDWFKDSAIIDFTNPQAKEWWLSKRDYLLQDIGIDGFKTDGGECVFSCDIALDDGSEASEARNRYAESYLKGYYDYGASKKSDYVSFSRAGFIGAHRYPGHWAGDERSTFDAFRRTIVAGINAATSGVLYWGFDLGGFNGDIPTVDLYIRATQMATFAPIMQYHAESRGEFNQDRTPWNIAERWDDHRAITLYRRYAHLRMQLIPYISWSLDQAILNGRPLMGGLFLDNPRDSTLFNITDQYYFGPSLLVCPVVEEGSQGREVYLPHGEYIDFFTLEQYSGGRSLYYDSPLEIFPLFIKKGEPLFLAPSEILGEGMTNESWSVETPMVVVTSSEGYYQYGDIEITLTGGQVSVKGCDTISVLDPLGVLKAESSTTFQWFDQRILRYEVCVCSKIK